MPTISMVRFNATPPYRIFHKILILTTILKVDWMAPFKSAVQIPTVHFGIRHEDWIHRPTYLPEYWVNQTTKMKNLQVFKLKTRIQTWLDQSRMWQYPKLLGEDQLLKGNRHILGSHPFHTTFLMIFLYKLENLSWL